MNALRSTTGNVIPKHSSGTSAFFILGRSQNENNYFFSSVASAGLCPYIYDGIPGHPVLKNLETIHFTRLSA
jgi:hypothetical protein